MIQGFFVNQPAKKPRKLRGNRLGWPVPSQKNSFLARAFAKKLKQGKYYIFQWFICVLRGFPHFLAGGYFPPNFWGKKGRGIRGSASLRVNPFFGIENWAIFIISHTRLFLLVYNLQR